MRRGRNIVSSVIGLGSQILLQGTLTPNRRPKKAMRDMEGQRRGMLVEERVEEAAGSEQEAFQDAEIDEGGDQELHEPGLETEQEQQNQGGAPRAKQRLFHDGAAPAGGPAAPASTPMPPIGSDITLAEVMAELLKLRLGQQEAHEAAKVAAAVQEQMGALRQEFSQAIERLTRVEGQVKEALTKAQEACDKVQAARTVADDVRKAADEAGREAKVAKQLAARSEERITNAASQAARAEQKATEAAKGVAEAKKAIEQLAATVAKLQRPAVSYAAAAGATAAAGSSGGATASAAFPPRPTMTKDEALSNAALSGAQLKQTARIPTSQIREGETALAAMSRLLQAAGVREAPVWAEFRGQTRGGERLVSMELRDGGQLSAMNKKKSQLGFRVSVTRSPLQAQRFKELRATSCFKQREEQELAKKAAGQYFSIIHMVEGSVLGGDYITLEFARAWDQFQAASAQPPQGGQRERQAEGEASGSA